MTHRFEQKIIQAAEMSASYSAVLKAYQRACESRNWPEVERLRVEVTARHEAYLDHLASVYKELEIEARRGGL